MKKVTLGNTGVTSSEFILGTASLLSAGWPRNRYRLLKEAVECGFTHFDTAPYYGFGVAESDLKPVLREHPNLTVTTKVGIYPPGGVNQHQTVIYARKILGKAIPSLSKPSKSFDLALAKSSLHGSLKRLGRDCVDIYTLHEPELGAFDNDEWLRWLQDCVSAGIIRSFGLAGTADKLAAFATKIDGFSQYLQVSDSLEGREANLLTFAGMPVHVTYGYMRSARASGSTANVKDILSAALRDRPSNAIIVSTRRPDRLSQLARIAETTS